MSRMTKAQVAERDEALDYLRELLQPGDTIHLTLEHVSRSGMVRDVVPYVIKDNDPIYLGGYVATALGWPRRAGKDGVRVDGCGMDMGFHLVYTLAWRLFDDGYALKHRWM